jgi:hypothetical protein
MAARNGDDALLLDFAVSASRAGVLK